MYKRILVPLDGSELSESILDHVVTIATSCQVPEVVLMRVREPLDEGVRETLDAKIAAELDKVYHDEAAGYLKGVAQKLKDKGIAVKTKVIAGNPAEEIIEYSRNNKVDLIIMSTHGRSGVSRWVFGSVADKVIRHTEVPVLIKPAIHRGVQQ
jgi:nucleotide-binding universal stress UspA family protein